MHCKTLSLLGSFVIPSYFFLIPANQLFLPLYNSIINNYPGSYYHFFLKILCYYACLQTPGTTASVLKTQWLLEGLQASLFWLGFSQLLNFLDGKKSLLTLSLCWKKEWMTALDKQQFLLTSRTTQCAHQFFYFIYDNVSVTWCAVPFLKIWGMQPHS